MESVIDDLLVHRLPATRRSCRIALVTETYPPEVNGVAMSVSRLVEGLHGLNHDLQLIRPRQPEPADRIEAASTVGERARLEQVLTAGWPIPHYRHLRMGAPCQRSLARLWSLQRPDVVHIATEGPLGWSALQAAQRLKLPVSSDFRTNFHAYGQHYRLGWLARPIMAYLRKFHNRADCTMVPTEPLRAQLAARGFQRLTVVARGVDTRLFDPQRRSAELRQQWKVRDDELVIVSVGRLAAEKNLLLVVRAYEEIREQVRARLLFVGDGPMRGALAERCPDALFAGQRHGEDLAAHYASSDLFLFASQTETFGNVTLEAMASGLPVVAFDCAAAGQLIDTGRNGSLVPGADEAAFVAASVGLAQDRAARLRLGTAARRRAMSSEWDCVVRQFEAVLAQVIDDPRHGTSATRPQPRPALG